jgi:AraC-like DNA-binding protein
MQQDLFPIPTFVVGVLAKFGIDFDEMLRCSGGSAAARGDTRVRLRTDHFFAFWRAVEAAGAPADLGLRLTDAPGVFQLDVASTAALLSENFGEALARLSRYKRLTCPEDIAIELNGNEARVQVRWLHASGNAPDLLMDTAFAWLCRIAAVGSDGTIRPIRIVGQHFNCPVQFNSTVDALVFTRESLEAPFTTHHPEMLEVISPALETALRERESSRSLVHQVCSVLTKTMGGKRPSIELVAKELRISVRTLQRRLEDEGTSYQRLLDEVRQRTARHLLASTDLDAGEIAFVLGFEELNSFSRAFQGWEGMSPGRWRTQNAGRKPTGLVQ